MDYPNPKITLSMFGGPIVVIDPPNPRALSRSVWRFGLGLRYPDTALYLESFARQTRPSARHGWRDDYPTVWEPNSRLRYGHAEEPPEIPPEIWAQAENDLAELVDKALDAVVKRSPQERARDLQVGSRRL